MVKDENNNFDYGLNKDLTKPKAFIDFLLKEYQAIVKDKKSSDKTLVISINGKYGTGKSTFITNYIDYNSKNDPNTVTVYYNAWENDYFEDPFISLVGQIYESCKRELPNRLKMSGAEQLLTAGGALATTAFMLTPGLSNIPAALSNLSKAAKTTQEKQLDNPINLYTQLTKQRVNFLNALSELGCEHSQQKIKLIFIDELDRCKPAFAIKLLETIKHFFSAQNTVFVIAVDRTQLLSIIRKAYGDSFDANSYLHRFFDYSIDLPQPDSFLHSILKNHLSSQFDIDLFNEISSFFRLSPREIVKLASWVNLMKEKVGQKGALFNYNTFVFLVAAKVHKPSSLEELRNLATNIETTEDIDEKLKDILEIIDSKDSLTDIKKNIHYRGNCIFVCLLNLLSSLSIIQNENDLADLIDEYISEHCLDVVNIFPDFQDNKRYKKEDIWMLDFLACMEST